MSGSDWGNENRIVFAVAAAVLLAILFYATWGLSALHTKEAITASHRASQYAKDTEQHISDSCTSPELSVMRECVTERVKASEENQRAANDLAAQNAMARWTYWLLVLGLAGTALTGVGLYYLAGNLYEMREGRRVGEEALDIAREANKIAMKAAKAQSRAYLSCTGGSYVMRNSFVMLHISCENNGVSPASEVKAEVVLRQTEIGALPEVVMKLILPFIAPGGGEGARSEGTCEVVPPKQTKSAMVIITPDKFPAAIYDSLLTGSKFLVSTVITWNDPFEDSQVLSVVLLSMPSEGEANETDILKGSLVAYNQSTSATGKKR